MRTISHYHSINADLCALNPNPNPNLNRNPVLCRWRKCTLATALLLLAVTGEAFAAVRYVDVSSASPRPPYSDWAAAAKTIQDAVDVAAPGDEIVVTNGTYATGGRAVVGTETNRVAVDKPLTVRSVNGPQFTIIQGFQVPGADNFKGAIRCVYLANGASLSGFTLTNGAALRGGGVWCESILAVATNCTLTGNSASLGGGASGGTLNNCTLTGNSASSGGGVADGPFGSVQLNNCIIYFNTATIGANNYSGAGGTESSLNYCCTTPQPDPSQGVGNITNSTFVSRASLSRASGHIVG